MSYEFITTQTEGPLFIVTINRPDQLNCLHPMGNAEMGKAFDEFAANPDLWVAIVTGAGEKAFSAGNDLKFAASGQKSPVPMPASGFGGLTSRYDLYKPVIAAVNGFAMGGGFEIALAADIIIAAENAKFALPEPKVGFAALASGMHRLPRQVPRKIAMEIMLTGEPFSAQRALELGFVNRVVPRAQLMEAALELAEKIAANAPLSVQASKRIALGIEDGTIPSEAADWAKSALESAGVRTSEDAREGPLAFAEKRAPQWKAR